MRWTLVPSPVGELLIAADEQGLRTVGFGPGSSGLAGTRVSAAADPVLSATANELSAYFAGALTDFTVPLSVRPGGEFERAVWAELSRIPYGHTRSYGQVAAAVGVSLGRCGDPGASAARAVGMACNRNPLPIVVPCHRVVGAGRKLVGFGGGLERKRFLLELEARVEMEKSLG